MEIMILVPYSLSLGWCDTMRSRWDYMGNQGNRNSTVIENTR